MSETPGDIVRFGLRLKAIRIERDLTQRAMSERTNIPLGTIRLYEQGRCFPSAVRLHQLVTTLDVSTERLFREEVRA